MPSPPIEALQCLLEFLAASANVRGGARMLELLAPTARVPWNGQMLKACDLSAGHYAADRATGRPDRPAFTLGEVSHWQTADGSGLLGAMAQEVMSNRAVQLSAGMRLTLAGWRLAWVTIAPLVWQEDEAIAHACALSECAAGPDWGAETWLERAFRRGPGRAASNMMVLANARFACHGTGRCCRNRMSIDLPASAQATIDVIPWERIAPELKGTQLESRPDGRLKLKGPDEVCRFLDEHTRCRIHAALGRAAFGPCAAYPFSFAETPEGVVATASSGCGSVRANLGPLVGSRVGDLQERLYLAPHVVATDTYRLTADNETSWEAFKEAEGALLEVLRGPGPLVDRLRAGAGLLAGPHEALAPLDVAGSLELRGLMAALTEGLAGVPVRAEPLRHVELRDPELMTGIIITLLYAKKASFTHDLLTALNLGTLLYFMTLAMQQNHRGGDLPPAFWELVGGVPTNSPGFIRLPDHGSQSPFIGMALRQRGYTSWLLDFAT
jgi:hypothetical protein